MENMMTPNATINVSVSHHYRKADYASELTSQGLLGERVEILQYDPLFSLILQADGYTSWISTDQLVEGDKVSGEPVVVTSHFLRILRKPSQEAEAVREAVVGSTLMAVEEHGDYYCLRLPDGQRGWAKKQHFGSFPACTAENIVGLAKEFLGYQYVWGGRTPKGFDCSGFVQTVFGLLGVLLPRDSWQQQENHVLSTNSEDAEPGDLLFFARTPKRVTHVGIALGGQRYIHASGWVRCNSLLPADEDFHQRHLDTFVSVNRYPLPAP